MTYQQTFKLLCLGDVYPAVFFNDFDVLYFIVESVKRNHQEQMLFFHCYRFSLSISCILLLSLYSPVPLT